MGGFDGEGVQGGSVLVVKTHSSVPMWSKVKGQLAYDLKVSLMYMCVCIYMYNVYCQRLSVY